MELKRREKKYTYEYKETGLKDSAKESIWNSNMKIQKTWIRRPSKYEKVEDVTNKKQNVKSCIKDEDGARSS